MCAASARSSELAGGGSGVTAGGVRPDAAQQFGDGDDGHPGVTQHLCPGGPSGRPLQRTLTWIGQDPAACRQRLSRDLPRQR